MTSDEIIAYMQANDRFAAANGIRLVEASPGRAVAEMEVAASHLNAVGVVHGGALFTLADFSFAVACNCGGTLSLAVNTTMNFVRPVTAGRLRAVCEQVADGKLASYQAKIFDQEGQLIALFTGLAYRKKESFPFSPR